MKKCKWKLKKCKWIYYSKILPKKNLQKRSRKWRKNMKKLIHHQRNLKRKKLLKNMKLFKSFLPRTGRKLKILEMFRITDQIEIRRTSLNMELAKSAFQKITR